MSLLWRVLVLTLSLFAAGCVTSRSPVLGPDTRVLPFLPGTQFETYERDEARAPWKKNEALSTFTADRSLEITELDDGGKPKNSDTTTIHPLSPGRFLVQTLFTHTGRFAYGVLEIRNGEGVVTGFGCKVIDQAAFRRDGGTIVKDDGKIAKDNNCSLDTASNPLAILRKLAAKPAGPQMRYIPVVK